jgi:hypothetical protein
MPLSFELTEPAGETFDPDKIKDLKPGTVDLFPELFGFVQICRRKPVVAIVRIAVLSFGKISLNDSAEIRTKQKSLCQAIEQGGEPAYCSNCNETRPTDHASRLSKGLITFGAMGEVVHRAKKQDDVEAIVVLTELPGVTNFCGYPK